MPSLEHLACRAARANNLILLMSVHEQGADLKVHSRRFSKGSWIETYLGPMNVFAIAAAFGYVEIVDYLINQKIDPFIPSGRKYNYTPLKCAKRWSKKKPDLIKKISDYESGIIKQMNDFLAQTTKLSKDKEATKTEEKKQNNDVTSIASNKDIAEMTRSIEEFIGVEKQIEEIKTFLENIKENTKTDQHFLILSTPPGNGETELVKRLATISGFILKEFVRGERSDAGVSQLDARIIEYFTDAKKEDKPVCLFIGEIDSLCPESEGVARTGYHNPETIISLIQMQIGDLVGSKVVLIGTTNYLQRIKPAVRDLAGTPVVFKLPGLNIREKIIRYHLNNIKSEFSLKLEDETIHSESAQPTMLMESLQGLTYQKIPGDGHCLFTALELYLDQEATYIRKIVAAHMEANIANYEPYYVNQVNSDFNQHIKDIREGREWATAIEIEVIQRLTDRPIIIIRPDANPTMPDNLAQYKGDPIFVYFNGKNHYDAFTIEDGVDAKIILSKIQTQIAQGNRVSYNPDPIKLDQQSLLSYLAEATAGWSPRLLKDYLYNVSRKALRENKAKKRESQIYNNDFIEAFEGSRNTFKQDYQKICSNTLIEPPSLVLQAKKDIFSDMVGLSDNEKLMLQGICEFVRDPIFYRQKGIEVNRNAIFWGPPGTGKTERARLIAENTNSLFINIDAGKYKLYENLNELKKVFELAKNFEKAIIFIDEMDAITQENSWARELLQTELDGFLKSTNDVLLVIGATNSPGSIARQIQSRFTEVIEVPLPDHCQRKMLFEMYLNKIKNIARQGILSVDFEKACDDLAKKGEGLSPRDIKLLINEVVNHISDIEKIKKIKVSLTIELIYAAIDRKTYGFELPISHSISSSSRHTVSGINHQWKGKASINKSTVRKNTQNSDSTAIRQFR